MDTSHSWLLGDARTVSLPLGIVAGGVMAAAGIGFLTHQAWWSTAGIVGGGLSLVLFGLFFTPWWAAAIIVSSAAAHPISRRTQGVLFDNEVSHPGISDVPFEQIDTLPVPTSSSDTELERPRRGTEPLDRAEVVLGSCPRCISEATRPKVPRQQALRHLSRVPEAGKSRLCA